MDSYYLIFIVALVIFMARLLYQNRRGRRAVDAFRSGWDAVQSGDWDRAERELRVAVRLEPISAPARRWLGRVLARQGRLGEAEEHLNMAAALEPRNAEGHADVGLFLAVHAPHRADEAIDALARAVELAPRMRIELGKLDALEGLRRHARFAGLLEAPSPDRR